MAGATRVAMRTYTIPYNNVNLTYLMGDQLGSTSLAVNATTNEVIETRYKAWGEVRYTTPTKTLPTRNTYTGQYSYMADEATDLGSSGFGLMYYNARWYDPYITHFVQADTIVPAGVQGLDRYAYVNNSPINYVDPSGHVVQGRCNYRKNYNCDAPTITNTNNKIGSAENLLDMLELAFLHYSTIYLVGDALELIQNDPAFIDWRTEIASDLTV